MNNKETAQRIVDRMVEAINTTSCLPWTKPWTTGSKPSVQVLDGYTTITIPCRFWSRSGRAYSGINVDLLSMFGKPGEYITFNQCKAEGGKVKKGAKSVPIMYWNMYRKKTGELNDDGTDKIVVIPILKTYNVFHISDCEGIEQKHEAPAPTVVTIPRYHSEPVPGLEDAELDPTAESIIAAYIARCQTLTIDREGESDRAYYSPAADQVVVPNVLQFKELGEYYSTMFHELGHSTGHKSRLNRFSGPDAIAAFGDESYSREELVAEITAASILNQLGMESGNTFRNSAAYVKSWSEHIKNDPMMFVTAAGRAEKAIACILGTAPAEAEAIAE